MEVSIIVPTYNRVGKLGKSIEALKDLDYPVEDYEIIVVNDGSSDSTEKFLKNIEGEVPNLRAIHQENQGVAAARNTGLEHTSGDYIFFTDDDCIVPRDWIRHHLKRYEEYEDIAGVNGVQWPAEMNLVEAFKLARHWRPYTEIYVMEDPGTVDLPTTNNLSYRAEVFDQAGNFDESLIRGSDTEHGRRVLEKSRILHDPEIRVEHLKKESFREFLSTKYSLGKSVNRQEEMHGPASNPRMTPSYILEAWKHFNHHAGYRWAWIFPILGALSISMRKLGEIRF